MGRTAMVCMVFATVFGIVGATNGGTASASSAGPAGISSTPGITGIKAVRFDGYAFNVPLNWPVYQLGRNSTRCVRYDTSAVYLGTPGNSQQCPAHLVGQAATVSVAASGVGGSPGGPAAGGATGAVAGTAAGAVGGPAAEP
jgi:hypothetical protein